MKSECTNLYILEGLFSKSSNRKTIFFPVIMEKPLHNYAIASSLLGLLPLELKIKHGESKQFKNHLPREMGLFPLLGVL